MFFFCVLLNPTWRHEGEFTVQPGFAFIHPSLCWLKTMSDKDLLRQVHFSSSVYYLSWLVLWLSRWEFSGPCNLFMFFKRGCSKPFSCLKLRYWDTKYRIYQVSYNMKKYPPYPPQPFLPGHHTICVSDWESEANCSKCHLALWRLFAVIDSSPPPSL